MHLTTQSAFFKLPSQESHTVIHFIWARTPMGTACRHVGLRNLNVLQNPTEGHRAAPNKTEVQILRNKKNAYWVARNCLPQPGENEIPHSLSYTFPNHLGKRRKSNPKPLVLSEARKQLMIYRLPQVLRLHLKRFRWACSRASHVAVNCRNSCFKGKWWGQMSLLLGGDGGSLGTLCFPWRLNESCQWDKMLGPSRTGLLLSWSFLIG